MAPLSRRRHLPAAASRHSAPRRHFVLHVPFALLHARHLSRRIATDSIPARLHPRGVIFPAAGCRPNCPCRRFSSATCSSHTSENGPISLGAGSDDFWSLLENCACWHYARPLAQSLIPF